jgi:glycosyltransferase involved in cell wall biosynthesis
MQTYQLKTAISNFSGGWAKRRWGIDCQVVYPPVDTNFQRAQKEKMILSVGRFAIEGEGHGKKQEEMLAAFRRMKEEGLLEWRYFCVGALGGTDRHRAHFAKLSATVSDIGAELIANINRDRLKDLYEQAAIFWHAAGYGEDEDTRPIFLEHFGISTVEAMAAGCVPVVINKGGQREIVEHCVNGFLWETLEELRAYTRLLMNDDRLRERMAEAARERAQKFSREAFVDKFLGQLVGSEGPQAAEQSHRARH